MSLEIFGTLGPACSRREVLREMFANGITGMRLNLSHTGLAGAAPLIDAMHEAAEDAGIRPLLLIDMQGPELRIGSIEKGRMLSEGEDVRLVPKETTGSAGADGIPVPAALLEKLLPGQELLIDDGKLLLAVTNADGAGVLAKTLRGGALLPGKSIAAPGITVESPALTEQDLENIRLAKKYHVTGLMQPFVRGRQDLLDVRKALEEAGCPSVRIYAKIENAAGVRALSELAPCADEIVIARGDLGNAVPLWELPGLQSRIAGFCRMHSVPFMVVTQMLSSMEEAEVPTRAETSDIYRAVMEGASSVMLTGETAAGKHPAEASAYLVRTARAAEKDREKYGLWGKGFGESTLE